MIKSFSLKLLTILLFLSLAVLNLGMIYPWFSGQGPANIGSIEVSYVSMARFIIDYFPHLSFAPYWYFGFPFHLFYTPLLPASEVLLNQLGGFSLWQSYRIITGLGFILAPVSLAFFTFGLTKKALPSFLAGLFYTFLPTIFYFILPSGEVAADMISPEGIFDPRRLTILARWGEGPHTLSLIFLPLAGLFFLKFLEGKGRLALLLTIFFSGLTALTNAVGFYALIFLLSIIIFSSLVKKEGTFGKLMVLSGLVGILTLGVISFWYNLSFLGTFFGEGGGVLANYRNLLPWGFVLLIFGAISWFFLCQKVFRYKPLIISASWFLLMFLFVGIYYFSAPFDMSNKRLEFAPQALRLIAEVDMSLSVLIAVLIAGFSVFLERKLNKIGQIIGWLIAGVLASFVILYGMSYLPYGQKAVSKEIDLSKTREFQISQWLEENVDREKGERVYVAGNYSFYLNYFTDLWQLRGGLYQAKTHPWPEHIYYQMTNGEDAEIALAWMKIANIKYLVVNTKASEELYKEYKNIERFEELKIVYSDIGDLIYEIPLSDTSPAKIVSLSGLKLLAPKKGDDKDRILAYERWLDKSRSAEFKVINNDHYQVKGQIGEGEGILIQMTSDAGFKAINRQESTKIVKDPLGFMVLIPEKTGEFDINLTHGIIWKVWFGYILSFISLLFVIYFLFKYPNFSKED